MTDQAPLPELDPAFQAALQRLHQLTVLGRWAVVLGLWLTIGVASLWGLRNNLALWQDYFTWAAVRSALLYRRWSAMGLIVCISMTLSVLLWQSRNILWGLPQIEQQRLRESLLKIHQQGASHPLWSWVYGKPRI
jgi:hypothetical protein